MIALMYTEVLISGAALLPPPPQIKQDTWSRFKLTDAAAELSKSRPHLGVTALESSEQLTAREAQNKLKVSYYYN